MVKKKLNLVKVLCCIYIVTIIFLGFNGLLNTKTKTDISAWNMYKYHVIEKITCQIDNQPFNCRKHFYHNTFANSAHSKFRKYQVKLFADYLTKNYKFTNHLSVQVDITVNHQPKKITYKVIRNKHDK